MPPNASGRLTHLGVPVAFHRLIMVRQAPRFHILFHLAIILVSIAAAVAAMAAWSRYVAAAQDHASAAHALLYDSDIGAESLGLLFTVLFAAGWLCGAITWRRGSESARNGWAADLMHEPAKNKAITDWLWRQIIRRYTKQAPTADDFLDRLGRGIVRDLRFATTDMLLLMVALGWALPARLSYATDAVVTDHPVLLLSLDTVRPLASTVAVVSGCPALPKDGNTLVYRLRFADGAEANLGNWHSLAGEEFMALESHRIPIARRHCSGAFFKRHR